MVRTKEFCSIKADVWQIWGQIIRMCCINKVNVSTQLIQWHQNYNSQKDYWTTCSQINVFWNVQCIHFIDKLTYTLIIMLEKSWKWEFTYNQHTLFSDNISNKVLIALINKPLYLCRIKICKTHQFHHVFLFLSQSHQLRFCKVTFQNIK